MTESELHPEGSFMRLMQDLIQVHDEEDEAEAVEEVKTAAMPDAPPPSQGGLLGLLDFGVCCQAADGDDALESVSPSANGFSNGPAASTSVAGPAVEPLSRKARAKPPASGGNGRGQAPWPQRSDEAPPDFDFMDTGGWPPVNSAKDGATRGKQLSETDDDPAADVAPWREMTTWLQEHFAALPLYMLLLVCLVSSCLAAAAKKKAMQVADVPFCLCLCQFIAAAMLAHLVLNAQLPPLEADRTAVWRISSSYSAGFMCVRIDGHAAAAQYRAVASTVYMEREGSLAIVAGSWLSAGDSSGAGMAIAFEPATTALVSFMLLKETDTAGTYRSLLLIVSGTALASIGEESCSWVAFVVAQLANCAASASDAYAKTIRRECSSAPSAQSELVLLHHTHRLGAKMLASFALPELPSLWSAVSAASPTEGLELAAALLSAGVVYAVSAATFLVMLGRLTLPAHAAAKALCRLAVIVSSTVFFRAPMGLGNILGCFVAVMGLALFAAERSRQMHEMWAETRAPGLTDLKKRLQKRKPDETSRPSVAALSGISHSDFEFLLETAKHNGTKKTN